MHEVKHCARSLCANDRLIIFIALLHPLKLRDWAVEPDISVSGGAERSLSALEEAPIGPERLELELSADAVNRGAVHKVPWTLIDDPLEADETCSASSV